MGLFAPISATTAVRHATTHFAPASIPSCPACAHFSRPPAKAGRNWRALARQFLQQPVGVVNTLQCLGDAGDSHRHGAVLTAVITEVAAQRLNIPVEYQSD